MANRWLATQIIESLRLRGLFSAENPNFSYDDWLKLIDDAMHDEVMPLLLRETKGDYLTTHLDYAMAAGSTSIFIPPRAESEQCELVQIADANGGWLAVNSLSRRENQRGGDVAGAMFQLDDDKLVFSPAFQVSSTVRVHYRFRPNRLVGESACGRITAINTATKAVTVAAVPADVTGTGSTTTSVAFNASTQAFDFVRGQPSFRCSGIDLVCSSIVGNVMTFAATLPTTLAVGDYVCIAGESPIAQIPTAAHVFLGKVVLVHAEMANGNASRIPAAMKSAEKSQGEMVSLLSQKMGSTSSPLINPYARGRGRRSRQRWF